MISAAGMSLDDGWTTFYSQLGFINSAGVQFGDTGAGTSYHITSVPGANVSLSFNGALLPRYLISGDSYYVGTGITLFGYSNCSYQVFLDGSPADSSTIPFVNGTLFSQNTLDMSLHTVTLVSSALEASGQQLAFDSALIQSVSNSS